MSLDTPSYQKIDGSGFKIAIISSRYNEGFVDALVHSAKTTIKDSGAPEPTTLSVPGAAELPTAASIAVDRGDFEAIICIGVVIAGDTSHHTIIGDSTASALTQLSVDSKIPIINGILVVENTDQAAARAGSEINRGQEFAAAALEMIQISRQWMK